ncbi:5-(carboxyamino)imidazole ribonucleotide synthase [Kangiella sp. HZ709]|uniref:5-(carboxyamino)imidazole ribonucleotide synthase n=1 Tax=Kangiella sp. HZ709 TaxID=2666328 RepID=UPI0012B0A806|nr:5-(carboxyamino)imidazole ribonucleotide synthase [Kangiella sp. HZ709]MRX27601.1 5-(carboxyamino)imidazole ribonucleotide synthase [Kangiella sp. HZ709]
MKVGIIGGGQLAQMLAQAGQTTDMSSLAMDFAFVAPEKDACAAAYGKHFVYPYLEPKAKEALENWSDVVTYEFESIPVALVQELEKVKPVHPSSKALTLASDRLNEKNMFNQQGIETARFATVNSLEDLQKAVVEVGLPAILKTRRDGYDGKGQVVLRDESELVAAWDSLAPVACILESMVNFKREVSIVASRNVAGEIAYYPLAENYHREGILRLSLSLQHDPKQQEAQDIIRKVMEDVGYVGTMAVELFDLGDKFAANELSPRVHNSGHWSMDGAIASQFKNHLLAITNQPLQDTSIQNATAMVNLIGGIPDKKAVARIPGAVLYDYGKEPKPGRKVGHINICADGDNDENFVPNIIKVLGMVNQQDLIAELLKSSFYK